MYELSIPFRTLSKTLCAALLGVLLVTPVAFAQFNANVDDRGVGLQGYDPVAYFTQGRAVRGSAEFSATHNEVTYHFATKDDRKRFLEDPDRYAPQYGGFCAYGAAHGIKLASDPQEWKIVNGKLFVVASTHFMERWSNSTPSYIKRADEIWARIKNKRPDALTPIIDPDPQ